MNEVMTSEPETRTTLLKAVTCTLVVAVSGLVLAACGLNATPQGSSRGVIPPTGQVDVYLELDHSLSTVSPELGREYVQAAMGAAESFFQRGGTLVVRVFSGDVHSVDLLRTTLPAAGDLAGVERAQQVVPMRSALEGALEEAFGLRRPAPRIAAAMRRLAPGTDVASNFAAALDSAKASAGDGAVPIAVMISDGKQTSFPSLPDSSSQQLASSLRPALSTNAHGVWAAVFGVGASRQTVDSPKTLKLVQAWRIACRRTGAEGCFVSPGLDLGTFLGGE